MTHSPLRNDADPEWRAMHRAAEAQEAEVSRLLATAFAALAARTVLLRIRSALRFGNVDQAMQAVPVGNLLLLRAALQDAILATAQAGSRVAMQAQAVVRLGPGSLLNADIAFWARTHSAGLVVGITEQTRQALRRTIARAIQDGLSPTATAKLVEAVVGLNKVQADAVMNRAEELLERGVAAAKREATLARYAAQLRRQRARVIARHELMQAANEGRRAVWEREVRDGLISPDRWEREWAAVTHDNRTCKYCLDADGTRAPIHGAYPNGSDGPPGHVLCRCTENLVRVA